MVIKPASTDPTVLDTEALMASIAHNNRKFRLWASISVVLLAGTMIIGVIGIYQGNNAIHLQNSLANQNKTHIDCIVKLLATPQKPGTTHKFITNAGHTCNINFN